MDGDIIERALVSIEVYPPKPCFAGICQPWRKLVAQKPKQAEHHIACSCSIGHDLRWFQSCLLLEQALKDENGIAKCSGHNDTVKA